MRFLFVGLWLLFGYLIECQSMCTPEYGPNPTCRFVPAPPGKTPPCARPGLTYCEYPDHYPSKLIYHLIQKWQFNHKSLIINEAKEEFNSVFFPLPPPVYGPPAYVPNYVQNAQGEGYHYPEPIYIPKPDNPAQGLYIPPKSYQIQHQLPHENLTLGFSGYPQPNYNKDGTFLTYKYTSNVPQSVRIYTNSYHQSPASYAPAPPYYSHVNDIWKRNERLKRSLRTKRTQQVTSNYLEQPIKGNSTSATLLRKRRQANVSGQPLCRSRSNFIMPRAALNSKGNWMYVVNMPEANQQFTQLVRSETCLEANCNGLCQLPQGYSSKCEQKYVQKRLIALDGGGTDLYSDTFWFPSCCVCTVSNG